MGAPPRELNERNDSLLIEPFEVLRWATCPPRSLELEGADRPALATLGGTACPWRIEFHDFEVRERSREAWGGWDGEATVFDPRWSTKRRVATVPTDGTGPTFAPLLKLPL